MNSLTGIRITTGRVPAPEINWDKQPVSWLSFQIARLDGGFTFNAALLPVDALFAETVADPEEVRIVDMAGGRMGVLTGEMTLVRALLAGKGGVEVRRYRL